MEGGASVGSRVWGWVARKIGALHAFLRRVRFPEGSGGACNLRACEGYVLDGTLAAFVEADELAEDLLVLLADGLTEERLVALLTRWSKAWRRKPSGGAKEMDQLD